MSCEILVSASIVVDDLSSAVEKLCSALGLPDPLPRWYSEAPGVRAMFCRVHPSYAVAPTRLELVSAAPIAGDTTNSSGFPVAAVAARQGSRPIKVHSTPIGMPDEAVRELGERLWDLSVAHGYLGSPPSSRVVMAPVGPFADADVDGGLFVEAIRTADLQLPPEALYAPADVPADAVPGTMVRVFAREYLVEDLDTTLRILGDTLRWKPTSVSETAECRRAVMGFSAPRSARVELIQPTGPGRIADAFEQLGPGAWTIRVSVVDVDAKASDLAARGTPFTLQDGVVRPYPEVTLNVPFEFVNAPV
jgi:hypothetical protein